MLRYALLVGPHLPLGVSFSPIFLHEQKDWGAEDKKKTDLPESVFLSHHPLWGWFFLLFFRIDRPCAAPQTISRTR